MAAGAPVNASSSGNTSTPAAVSSSGATVLSTPRNSACTSRSSCSTTAVRAVPTPAQVVGDPGRSPQREQNRAADRRPVEHLTDRDRSGAGPIRGARQIHRGKIQPGHQRPDQQPGQPRSGQPGQDPLGQRNSGHTAARWAAHGLSGHRHLGCVTGATIMRAGHEQTLTAVAGPGECRRSGPRCRAKPRGRGQSLGPLGRGCSRGRPWKRSDHDGANGWWQLAHNSPP
jgi:hypothetical protein